MKTLVRQLSRWQFRERIDRIVWGLARWLGIVTAGLVIFCTIDWVYDRYQETPFLLRLGMSVVQVAVAVAAAILLFFKLDVPPLWKLAMRAETAIPEAGHRFVTALQLNQPDARIQGMSRQLIEVVTAEAETLATQHNLLRLADNSLRKRSLLVVAPIALVVCGFLLLHPALLQALLARQALLPADIPRSVALENITPSLWPSGDEVTLQFRVSGKFNPNRTGSVRVYPEGQPSETYPLTWQQEAADGTAIYTSQLPPSSVPLTFRAQLQDGRTRGEPGRITFAPRPVVKDIATWIRLPLYVDPQGQRRYERFQPQGEVTALPDCGLRIECTSSKPVTQAEVIVFTRDGTGEKEHSRHAMQLSEDRSEAAVEFEIPSRASSYRIELTDEHGFKNIAPPRRGISFAADDPPRVNLLPEVLKDPREPGPLEDYEVSGMPLVLGGQVQIGYAARSPLGLSRAAIVYRVNEGAWTSLPLSRTEADLSRTGPFVPELGVFQNSGPFGQVEFYPFPAPSEDEPPGLEAGGRYNFQTGALTKILPDGRTTKLEVGDRVEFYVEVFDRNPARGRPGGKSESRLKAVVTQNQLEDWARQRDQSRDRLRQIEERQRGVFTPQSP